MKTLNLVPGSKDWLEFRSHHFTASEASALMGCNPAMSRADLLKEKYSSFNIGIKQTNNIATTEEPEL